MALGLLLRISSLCFLLFGSAGSQAGRGSGLRRRVHSSNVADDWSDDATFMHSDDSNWQLSDDEATGPVYASSNKPSVARLPGLVSSPQNAASAPAGPAGVGVFNWGLGSPAKPLRGPVQPPLTSLNVAPTNQLPAPPAGGSPSFNSWQPERVGSSSGVTNMNKDVTFNKLPHLVYEEVFHYPSANPGPSSRPKGGYLKVNYLSKSSSTASKPKGSTFPRNPANVGSWRRPSWIGNPSSWYKSMLKQKPAVNAQKVLRYMVRPPPRFIMQTRNGYNRARYSISHSNYSPNLPLQVYVSSKGQLAATKGVKSPKA